MHKMKRRFVTLIEMMIVMFLIAMIIGAVAYKYQGSLEEGKAFKTKVGIEKLTTILTLVLADHPEWSSEINSKWQDLVKNSPLVQNSNDLIKDGWGNTYDVKLNQDGQLDVISGRYNEYKLKNPTTMFGDQK